MVGILVRSIICSVKAWLKMVKFSRLFCDQCVYSTIPREVCKQFREMQLLSPKRLHYRHYSQGQVVSLLHFLLRYNLKPYILTTMTGQRCSQPRASCQITLDAVVRILNRGNRGIENLSHGKIIQLGKTTFPMETQKTDGWTDFLKYFASV